MIVVADTSPINYLILIGEIDVLPALYEQIVIPDAVLEELTRPVSPAAVRKWLENPPAWLDIRTPGSTNPEPSIPLDAGELEAIALAEELDADLLIVDDWAARSEAERLGLRVLGTLGVLRDAAADGLLDLCAAVARLRQTNFRVSATFLENLLHGNE